MDGMMFADRSGPGSLALPVLAELPELRLQHTLRSRITCSGVALHSGRVVGVAIGPAPADAGIVFRRTDLGIDMPARFDHVVDTRLCTVVAPPNRADARVGTVEHLMAAIAALGLDNALIEVDGPELPVFDGSAEPWIFLLDCAGVVQQHVPAATVEVLRTVRVEDAGAMAELRPGGPGLQLDLTIDFEASAIGRQGLSLALTAASFRNIARARTFTEAHEIAGLQAAGLARGGSLENAVVVDGARVLNPSGLRMADEFVRHKMLDAVGDLALAGAPLQGRFTGHRSGHALNNKVLRALFADPANWRLSRDAGWGWSAAGETAAAA